MELAEHTALANFARVEPRALEKLWVLCLYANMVLCKASLEPALGNSEVQGNNP
jgi:hypothetical protein